MKTGSPALRRWDAIVLGAGVAGLAAARGLSAAGRKVLLVEARDRFGGRVWTRTEPGIATPIELGAEFVHGRSPPLVAALQQAGAGLVDAPVSHWIRRQRRLVPAGDPFGEVRSLMGRLDALGPGDLAVDDFLARTADDPRLEEARSWARLLVEGFDAADPARASARATADEWRGSAGPETSHARPGGGYGRLLAHLVRSLDAARVTVRLQTVVREVRWRAGRATILAAGLQGEIRAEAPRIVVTLPAGVLDAAPEESDAVRFTPLLPGKRDGLAGVAMGAAIKVVLVFDHAFWEASHDGRYMDAAFFHSPDAAFPTFWTALPQRAPVLTAWAGGPRAARLSGLPAATIVRNALDALASVFGPRSVRRAVLAAAYLHDWQNDPFARGAYSYVRVGAMGARAVLAAPVEGTIFFAGEATDTSGDAGTVAGALASGVRAAREVIASE